MEIDKKEKSILWFKEIGKEDIPIVGGKAANLGEMTKAGFPVPMGFAINAYIFKEFMEETGIKESIFSILKSIDVDDTKAIQLASEKIREIVMSKSIPEHILSKILEAYKKMKAGSERYENLSDNAMKLISAGRDIPYVVVRSSATAEDLPNASFAGQQATILFVKGEEQLIRAIKECWASLYTARAIFYREKNGFEHEKVLLCAIVQKQIDSEKAGTAFSIHPSTGNKNEIIIEAGWGQGDAVVGGEITPNNYIVNKETFEIKNKSIGEQQWKYIRNPDDMGMIKVELPENKKKTQVLDDSQIIELAKIVKKIENYYKVPQDIEWCIEEGHLYIVQSRPITFFGKEETEERKEPEGNIIIKGLGASPGIASGKASLILSPEQADKIEKGDILVTRMTDPDWVPIMLKASGIITDEGGMTCFGEHTNILTNKGFLKISEVYEKINSNEELFIFSFDSKNLKPVWKRIINSFKRKSSAISISTSQSNRIEHNTLDITENHKVFTFKGRELIKKEIKSILEDNEHLCIVEKLPINLASIKNDKLGYLMGALLSDGNIRVDKYKSGNARIGRVTFTQKQDIQKAEFIKIVKEYYSDLFSEEMTFERDKSSSSTLRGKTICGCATDFVCFKLVPAQKIMEIYENLDSWLLEISESSALNFLAGLIDGDGSFYENRLHIYIQKEKVIQGVVLACLKLGIVPEVTVNRNIHHIQIMEKIEDILFYSKRIKGETHKKINGTKLFSAKQVLRDIIESVNYKGKVKPYVNSNLLIDSEKIKQKILPMLDGKTKEELSKVINSDLRMYRTKKVKELGVIDVYNIEVEADNEIQHNYVVFTKKYSPVLVSNCHAAIVSRELGIPCIVGTSTATKVIKHNQEVTLDAVRGIVYGGKIEIKQEKKEEFLNGETSKPITSTKIYMNLGVPEKADEYSKLWCDGIGLMRIEFIIASYIAEHPNAMLEQGRGSEYIDKLAEGIAKTAKAMDGKLVVVRLSDFKTNEYRSLKGGEKFEPKEENPMIGWRGCSRYISPEFESSFRLECRAIKKVRDIYGHKNVKVMLPFVRNLWEVKRIISILESEGLKRGEDSFELWLMAEVPSIIFMANEFSKLCDGFSIGSNDLTQLILGCDRDSALLAKMGYFDERDEAVKRAIVNLIRRAHENGVKVSICGQAPSVYPDFCEFLVKEGIDSMSVNPDVVNKTRVLVSSIERKILLEKTDLNEEEKKRIIDELNKT